MYTLMFILRPRDISYLMYEWINVSILLCSNKGIIVQSILQLMENRKIDNHVRKVATQLGDWHRSIWTLGIYDRRRFFTSPTNMSVNAEEQGRVDKGHLYVWVVRRRIFLFSSLKDVKRKRPNITFKKE